MQGFINVKGVDAEDLQMPARDDADAEAQTMALLSAASPRLIAVRDIVSAYPLRIPGVTALILSVKVQVVVLGTVEDIAALIAAAQAAPPVPQPERVSSSETHQEGAGMNAYEKQRAELFDWHTRAQRSVLDLLEAARDANRSIAEADIDGDKAAASKAHEELRRLRAKMDAVARAFEDAR